MSRTHSVLTLVAAPLVVIATACSSTGGSSSAPTTAAATTSAVATSSAPATSAPATTTAATTPATAPPTTVFTCVRTPSSWDDNVRLGDCDTHGYVQTIEDRLTVLGYPCTVDNEFRADTDAALRNFQRDKGLAADGQVGPNTWAALTEGGIGD